jgi:hypothetical protein
LRCVPFAQLAEGRNADAVPELATLLMLGHRRRGISGNAAEKDRRVITAEESIYGPPAKSWGPFLIFKLAVFPLDA